jgi:hypothetical protein
VTHPHFQPGEEVKQIKLTEKHIQGFMAAYEDIAKIYDGAESDKEGLTQLEAALKNSRPIQFKENIALVLKYFDQLAPIMQVGPAD